MPEFTITLNNRKILDGFLQSLGLDGRSGPVLRILDKLAKIGRERVVEELQQSGEGAGAGLSSDAARQVLDFAESGRGGADVLAQAERALAASPIAREGIDNLPRSSSFCRPQACRRAASRSTWGWRGLDYYTGIVYETTINGWEKFGSVASGGRYDDLASLFTPRRLPGVGASIGLDRLLALLEEAGSLTMSATATPVLVANFPGTAAVVAFGMAARLRAAGIGAEVYPDAIPIGKQMRYGSLRGHKLAVIVGPDEASGQVFNLRNLATREEDKGLAMSVLEDSVQSALEILKQQGSGS